MKQILIGVFAVAAIAGLPAQHHPGMWDRDFGRTWPAGLAAGAGR